MEGAEPGGCERYRSVPQASGRLLSRSFRGDRAGPGAAARFVRVALSDLPSGARRRGFYAGNAAGAGEARRRACNCAARTGGAAGSKPAIAGILRIGRAAGPPGGTFSSERFARAARGPGIRRSRYGVADSPANVSAADRRAATGVHTARAIRRAIRAPGERGVRARYLFPIDRARPGAGVERPEVEGCV